MDNSSKRNDPNEDALDVRDLLAAANHVRAVAIRRNCEALHGIASQLGKLASVAGGAAEEVG